MCSSDLRGDEGGDHAASALAGMGENVAHEVNAATLPGGIEYLGDGGLDALVGVRDHELDATQTTAGELAQERGPERFGHRAKSESRQQRISRPR